MSPRPHRHGEHFRLGRGHRWLVYLSAAALWVTGAGWLLAHSFFMREGEFGPEPNVLEHPLLVLHGFCAWLAIWAFGLIWVIHARRSWRARRNRRLGASLVAMVILLGASGWGLYYLGDERWRAIGSMGHWAIGLAVGVVFPWHVIHGRKAR